MESYSIEFFLSDDLLSSYDPLSGDTIDLACFLFISGLRGSYVGFNSGYFYVLIYNYYFEFYD